MVSGVGSANPFDPASAEKRDSDLFKSDSLLSPNPNRRSFVKVNKLNLRSDLKQLIKLRK